MDTNAAPLRPVIPPAWFGETVTAVHHWTPRLFSFRCTRDPALRFTAGQFAMIGLLVDGKPLVRAYSMVSPPWEDSLEFLSIKVPDGPLTSRLQHIRPGDTVLIGRKPVGTLLADNLLPGRTLYCCATGTGLAPFLSLLRDPDTLERFPTIVLAHAVREVAELAYRDLLARDLAADPVLGELVAGRLRYRPSVTREAFATPGRITDALASGALEAGLGLPPLDPAQDRVMICGSEAFNADMKMLLERRGFIEGSNHAPGSYVLEKAFVEK
jgi:ferredoxin/flavodoxin---NADP+ reductase